MSNKHDASAALSMETFRDLTDQESSANTTSRGKGKRTDGDGDGKLHEGGDRTKGSKTSLLPRSESGITSSEISKTYRLIESDCKCIADEKESWDETFPCGALRRISRLNEVDENREFSTEDNDVNVKYESEAMEPEMKRRKVLSLILMMIFLEMDLPSDSYHQVLESEVMKRFFAKLAASELRLLTAAHCDDSVEVSRSWPASTLSNTNFKNLLLMHWKCRRNALASSADQTY